MSTSSTTHEPDADASIPGSDELTDIEKQQPISTESLTKEEKLASDLAIVQVLAHHSIFDEEYPDGGFRAWLIVFGVSTYSPSHVSPPSRTMSIQLAKHKFFCFCLGNVQHFCNVGLTFLGYLSPSTYR